jgi:ABC-type branched-subunit amino acid transport system ATPase component
MTAPLLQLTDVSYTYGSYRALNQVSFEVEAGEMVVLAGRNGAGKTTLCPSARCRAQVQCAAGANRWARQFTGPSARCAGS